MRLLLASLWYADCTVRGGVDTCFLKSLTIFHFPLFSIFHFLKFLPYLDQKVWFSLHYFFWADLFSTYAFTWSHGLCLLLRKPHHPPPPPNTLDCSLSILGCQNMLKSRRKSMKEEPEVIHTWVEVFPTSSHPLGWLFFGVWKDVKSKSHPFRGLSGADNRLLGLCVEI